MLGRAIVWPALCGAALIAFLLATPYTGAQSDVAVLTPDEAEAQLERATQASADAQARASRLASEAKEAEEAAVRTAREAAALAAQIQVAQADIVASRARFSLAQVERARLAQRLADRQQPLARLTAALQINARRPLALSALQPGSLKDLVYVRAVLDSAVPQIRDRTATLRDDLERGRDLERRARRALANLRANEQELRDRQAALAKLETTQRLASRDARASAAREEQRALAFAEDARDLDALVDQLDQNAILRRRLAALSGPVRRPADMSAAQPGAVKGLEDADLRQSPEQAAVIAAPAVGLRDFQLPVQGRTITGFGERRESGVRSKGLILAPVPSAQIIVPASGRVAFSGPYEGFGRIVIIEHPGGWMSVVTGLQELSVSVSEEVTAGEPLGTAGITNPIIGIELRREGEPVNPLNYLN